MTHARTTIRKTIVSLLKNNSTLRRVVGDRVYESKIYPIVNTPSIVVYTPNEQIVDHTITFPRIQTRQLTLIIEIFAKENTSIDQISDSLCLEVEDILASDLTLGGMIKDLALNSSETIYSSEGDKPIAIANLNYSITYRTKENYANRFI